MKNVFVVRANGGKYIESFLHGDYVLTPTKNSLQLSHGVVEASDYYYAPDKDGCPHAHRSRVKWNPQPVPKNAFPDEERRPLKSSLTGFRVRDAEIVLEVMSNRG